MDFHIRNYHFISLRFLSKNTDFIATKQKLNAEELASLSPHVVFKNDCELFYGSNTKNEFNTEQKSKLQKILNVLNLVGSLMRRDFLKPWWKTVFEYNNFMHRNFLDDTVRETVAKWVCEGEKQLKADEFRAQIAKHVRKLTQKLKEDKKISWQLEDGDFFIVERSNKFFHLETIEKYIIYLKENEVLGKPSDTDAVIYDNHYYGKYLTKLLPQRDYASMFQPYSFYIYVREYTEKASALEDSTIGDSQNDITTTSENINQINLQKEAKEYYKMIERLFVFVAKEFVHRGKEDFIERFQMQHIELVNTESEVDKEQKSVNDMWNIFKESLQ